MNATQILKQHYEKCFIKNGDNHLGADWTREKDLYTRYDIMLSIVNQHNKQNKILDFGCGSGMLYQYICSKKIINLEYNGIDINEVMIQKAKSKFQNISFNVCDIHEQSNNLQNYDYIICNGVFTEKLNLTHQEMFSFFSNSLKVLFSKTNIGIAFNLMSKHVDYERDDLFHVGYDELANFLTKNLSKNYILRNDYGLYEYTTYLYK